MIWYDIQGNIISCLEKIKILNQNLEELKNLQLELKNIFNTKEYEYALEDAILLGVSKVEFDKNLTNYLLSLV